MNASQHQGTEAASAEAPGSSAAATDSSAHADAGAHCLLVLVALPAHSPLAATPLHYTHHEWLPAGTLVRVPLGQRSVLGVVWDSGPHTQPPPAGVQPKAILQAWNNVPPLDATWRQLVAFTARYYQRSLGEVALAALPPQLRELDEVQLARRLKALAKKNVAQQKTDATDEAAANAADPATTPLDQPTV